MAAIRYLKVTQTDGTRYILRVTRESPVFIGGFEVNAEGDEVVPSGYERRHRTIDRGLIKKTVEMRMNPKYTTLEVVPASEHAKKTAAQLDADIDEVLARGKEP